MQKARNLLRDSGPLPVGLLRNYCQQARRTAELDGLLAVARASKREADDRPAPRQSALARSIVEQVVSNYRAGASTHELAKRYGIRRGTVRDVLRREGIDPAERSHRSKFTDEMTAELRERYESGTTQRELATLYGVSKSTIGRMLRTT